MLHEAIENSALYQHLSFGDISVWETSLNLRATVGFPYSNYKYYDSDWESELEYDKFIDFGRTASSISGTYFNREEETSYSTTIILYNGKYYVQVEKDWQYSSRTDYNCDSFPDYLSALKYAYEVVFN